MQSFKEYLTEAVGNKVKKWYVVDTGLVFQGPRNELKDIKDQIIGNVMDLLAHHNIEAKVKWDKSDNVCIIPENFDSISEAIKKEWENIIDEECQSDASTEVHAECYWPPVEFVDADTIILKFKKGEHQTLKGIEKLIKTTFLVLHLDNIKVGLVGLVNLKKPISVKVEIKGNDGLAERLRRIIFKNITNGDILDFQEELINRDLKDYAKF